MEGVVGKRVSEVRVNYLVSKIPSPPQKDFKRKTAVPGTRLVSCLLLWNVHCALGPTPCSCSVSCSMFMRAAVFNASQNLPPFIPLSSSLSCFRCALRTRSRGPAAFPPGLIPSSGLRFLPPPSPASSRNLVGRGAAAREGEAAEQPWTRRRY